MEILWLLLLCDFSENALICFETSVWRIAQQEVSYRLTTIKINSLGPSSTQRIFNSTHLSGPDSSPKIAFPFQTETTPENKRRW